MKIRRERVSAAPAQACSPQRSSRVDRDSLAVGGQRQRNFQSSRKPTSHYRTRPESWHCRLPDTRNDRFQLHCERPKLCGCSRALHRDSIVTAVMEGGKRAFELALTGTDSRKVMIATVESGRLLQSVGFFTTCSGGLFLSFCCFFLSSSFVLDFLQSEIVLEGIHPCNVHELPNGKFRLGNRRVERDG